jgi:hypothetical protein
MVPSIGSNKKCPSCREQQRAFIEKEPLLSAIKSAENKLNEFRLAESEELQDLIFASVFGKNNLIKRAQEETEEQSSEGEPQVEQAPIEPEPNEPAMPQKSEINIDMAANDLANKVSNALQAVGIDPSSKDVADVINALAWNSDKKLIVAQAATTPTEPTTPPKKPTGLKQSLDRTIRRENTPSMFQKFRSLTPTQATAVNNIFGQFIRLHGAETFTMPILSDPATAVTNLQIMKDRSRLIGNLVEDLSTVLKTRAESIDFLISAGVDPTLVKKTFFAE